MPQLLKAERILLSGNEAVARAAADAGVRVGTGYPGTPSTEILENVVRHYPQIDAQWSPNEKVALEVGMGAAFAGARVLVTMKHVGVNVAADPLFTLSYTGLKGGLVLISADDPGMHSSQNEQDNRQYGPFAQVPILEPADSQETYDFARLGFDLSERFDVPVMLRMTTRVCHGKSVVHTRDPEHLERDFRFERDMPKFVMIPAHARRRHVVVKQRTRDMRAWAESAEINAESGEADGSLGVVAGGVAAEYVREILPDVPMLKIATAFPLPEERLRAFAERFERVVVVEELEPYLETAMRAMGLKVEGKPEAMRLGELDPDRVREIFGLPAPELPESSAIPPRPPVLCPGCPHRATYAVLKKMKLTVAGDIGCYTLAALPPLSTLDTTVCMGAGVGHALGLSKVVSAEDRKKIVAVIGDSTFVHSGVTGLIDIVYNGGDCTVLVLDNGTTAMTGRQDHPATGMTLSERHAPRLDIEAVCRAVGVQHVTTVDPWDLEASEKAVAEAIAYDGPAVVIERGPCVLIDRKRQVVPFVIDREKCKECGLCARAGCPAIRHSEEEGYSIDAERCRACELCAQLCKFGAISPADMQA